MVHTIHKRPYLVLISFLSLLLCSLLFLTGCSIRQNRLEKSFETLMNEYFTEEVKADSISLNYSLAAPEKYGITDAKITLGECSIRQMQQDLCLNENYLQRLTSLNCRKLTPESQLTYQIVQKYLETDLELGNYNYYKENLGPTTGIQAQLPILLAEYSFYDKDDIEAYLALLPCVYDYFEDIVQFEREKSREGLFMSDAVANRIINQCEAFIADPEHNFLIQYFNEKILGYRGLSKEEILDYAERNAKAVSEYVIPAYQMLSDALKELLGTGTNDLGLYYYPQGQFYYQCLAKSTTGSDKSMTEMTDALDAAIAKGIGDITALAIAKPDLLDHYMEFSSFPLTDPEKILADLKEDIQKDFPEAIPVDCNIKYVPASLSEYLSPAMYLVPPIDDFQSNDIYINGKDKKTLSFIYTTVAHEGYPGHLYQCVYFRNSKPDPIRSILEFSGYDEGWATYVELYSYRYAGIDQALADFLRANNIILLSMYARADIGIHYEGWTEDETVKYIKGFIGETETAKRIHQTLLEEPGIYLPYAIGYLEIMELKEKAMQALGAKFNEKDFHKFFLDIGPAQFSIINERLDTWLEEKLMTNPIKKNNKILSTIKSMSE